jgi:DNA-3-methyladenine glycosylase I
MATSDGAVIGEDGKPRCPWAGSTVSALVRYRDRVWGKRTFAEPTLFEALTLGCVRGRPQLEGRVR